MVSLLDMLFPRDLFGAKTHSTAPGSAVSSNSSGQKHPRSELSIGIEGSHQPYREFGISLHRNPPRNSGRDVDTYHPFRTSPLLPEVPSLPVPKATTDPESQGTGSQGISEPGRQQAQEERNVRPRRHVPTAPGSGIWSDCHSRTTWWSLSECDLISERSAPEPPAEYQKIDVGKLIEEAVQHSEELPDVVSWQSDNSDVIYLGELNSPPSVRPCQSATITPKLEPVSSHSS